MADQEEGKFYPPEDEGKFYPPGFQAPGSPSMEPPTPNWSPDQLDAIRSALGGALKSPLEMVGGAGELMGVPGAAAFRERMQPENDIEGYAKAATDIGTYMASPTKLLGKFAGRVPQLAKALGFLAKYPIVERTASEAVNAAIPAALHSGRVGPEANMAATAGAFTGFGSGVGRAIANKAGGKPVNKLFTEVLSPRLGRESQLVKNDIIPILREKFPNMKMDDEQFAGWIEEQLAGPEAKRQMIMDALTQGGAKANINSAAAEHLGNIRDVSPGGVPAVPAKPYADAFGSNLDELTRLADTRGDVPVEQLHKLKKTYGPSFGGGAAMDESVKEARQKISSTLARPIEDAAAAHGFPDLRQVNKRVSSLISAREMLTRAAEARAKRPESMYGAAGQMSGALSLPFRAARGAVNLTESIATSVLPRVLLKVENSTAYKLKDAGRRLAISRAIQEGKIDAAERLLGRSIDAVAAEEQ